MGNTSVNWTAVATITGILALVIPTAAYFVSIEMRLNNTVKKDMSEQLFRDIEDVKGRTQHISLHHDNYSVTLIKAGKFTYGFSDQGIITIDEPEKPTKIIRVGD